ncbi:MAG: methyltransferase domain-containing protein [Magnetococcales bacterium]|nr:methyltransferase domain-containing protein [Magnetococcales bacterium]
MNHPHDHQPHHRFDPAKAANLLDPRRRLIDDPLPLLQEMGIREGMQVADLGCGVGFFTAALLQAVGEGGQVIGVELQESMLALLRERFPAQPRLRLQLADLTATGLPDGCCDAVFVAFTLHEVAVADALQEIGRLLRRDGLLTVLDWGPIAPCPEREPGRQAGPPEAERLLPATLTGMLLARGWRLQRSGARLQGCHYWLSAQPPLA